jgi:quercetin dioxygenase-like cupin family protein
VGWLGCVAHPCIIPWNDAAVQKHDRGFMLPFVNGACGARQLRLHVSVIDPGKAAHPPHQHAGEEIVFLIEGTAEVLIGAETQVARAMTALFFPENILHGMRNIGDVPMKYAVIRQA